MSIPRLGLVAQLPFVSVRRDSLPSARPVFLQRSDRNICERAAEDEPCDTASRLYYTGEDEGSPALCPRHFYQFHFGPHATCVLRSPDEMPAY
jgi:hypothetical protein